MIDLVSTPQTVPATEPATTAPAADPAAPVSLFDDDRLTLAGLFAETWTAMSARAVLQLAGHGLSPVEFEVLIRLARSPLGSLRMTDLSAQTSLTTSGVTRVVDRLQGRGLLARESCTTDRRTTYAVISGAGRERLAGTLPEHLELIETWLVGPLRGPVDAAGAGLEPFVASLRRLRDHLAPCATAGGGGPPRGVRREAGPAGR